MQNYQKLLEHKDIICQILFNLYEVEGMDAAYIAEMVWAYFNVSQMATNGNEDVDLIAKWVDDCNCENITIHAIRNKFEDTFNPQESADDLTELFTSIAYA